MENHVLVARQIRTAEDSHDVIELGMTVVRNLTNKRLVVGSEGWAIDPKGLTGFSLITDELLGMRESGLVHFEVQEINPVSGHISTEDELAQASSTTNISPETPNVGIKKSGKKQKQQPSDEQQGPSDSLDSQTAEINTPNDNSSIEGQTSAITDNSDDNVNTQHDPF